MAAYQPTNPMESPTSHSRIVKIDDEDHTLGTTLVSALWARPGVMVAQYAQQHAVKRGELSVHCQTDGQVSATASLEEAVRLTKSMLSSLDEKMAEAVGEWENLPQAERDAINKKGVHALEALMNAAEQDLRESRLDDTGADEDNPFRRIVRNVNRRRKQDSIQ